MSRTVSGVSAASGELCLRMQPRAGYSGLMSDLGPAVAQLVEKATKGGKDWEQRQAVHDVLQAFDPKDARAGNAALRALGEGIEVADGRGEQILLLAVGALVEAGASPEVAWPVVEHKLKETLDGAAAFADACVAEADDPGIPESVKAVGHLLKKKMPRELAAWEVLKPRCLAAVSCLSRSSKVRVKARASKADLVTSGQKLDELVEEVTFFNQVLKLLDDVPLLVLHPDSRRGWRLVMNDVTTNLDMFVLLLDKLIGDPKKGMLAGARPNPKAVQALTDPNANLKKTPEIKVLWNLLGWTGVLPDHSLPDPKAKEDKAHADWVWLEGAPIDIPLFEGERVVIFQPPVMVREYEIEPAFTALSPRVELKSKISAAEVDRLIAKMALAAKPVRAKREAALEKARKEYMAQIAAVQRAPKKRR